MQNMRVYVEEAVELAAVDYTLAYTPTLQVRYGNVETFRQQLSASRSQPHENLPRPDGAVQLGPSHSRLPRKLALQVGTVLQYCARQSMDDASHNNLT